MILTITRFVLSMSGFSMIHQFAGTQKIQRSTMNTVQAASTPNKNPYFEDTVANSVQGRYDTPPRANSPASPGSNKNREKHHARAVMNLKNRPNNPVSGKRTNPSRASRTDAHKVQTMMKENVIFKSRDTKFE